MSGNMSRIFQRVIGDIMNKVVTKKLAESRTFQRAALKTHEHVQRAQGQSQKLMEEVKDQARVVSDEVAGGNVGKESFLGRLKKDVEGDLEALGRWAEKKK